MRHVLGMAAMLIGLVACTAGEKQALETSDAMEAKASAYCGITKGYELGDKTYMGCKEAYMQGLMDAAKAKQ